MDDIQDTAGPVRRTHVIKTYRYLRLAMVALVVMLFAAVGFEWWQTDFECLQTSISAYYYTPVRGVFIGALVAIGVCLVALKGSDEWEDILLNLAGMLAPVVAFVPTPGAGSCRSVPLTRSDASADIENNMVALFVAGAVGLVTAIVLRIKARDEGWDPRTLVGMAVAVLALVGGVVWFVVDRPSFESSAHNVAALTMFAAIVAVAVINARDYGRRNPGPAYSNRYAVIAVLMVVSLVGLGLVGWLTGWDHVVLAIEAVVIVLFAYLWLVQTHELWDDGLRPAPDAALPTSGEPVAPS